MCVYIDSSILILLHYILCIKRKRYARRMACRRPGSGRRQEARTCHRTRRRLPQAHACDGTDACGRKRPDVCAKTETCYAHSHTHAYIYIYIYIYVLGIYIYIYIYIYIHILHTYTYMYTIIHNTCIYIYIYIHMYLCIV